MSPLPLAPAAAVCPPPAPAARSPIGAPPRCCCCCSHNALRQGGTATMPCRRSKSMARCSAPPSRLAGTARGTTGTPTLPAQKSLKPKADSWRCLALSDLRREERGGRAPPCFPRASLVASLAITSTAHPCASCSPPVRASRAPILWNNKRTRGEPEWPRESGTRVSDADPNSEGSRARGARRLLVRKQHGFNVARASSTYVCTYVRISTYMYILRSRPPARDLTSIWTKVTLRPRQNPE